MRCKNINLLHTIITITILLFSHIHVRHSEPNWTWSWARFTLVANRTVNAFAIHWTGRVKITTVPNQTEPGPVKITPYGDVHAAKVIAPFWFLLLTLCDVGCFAVTDCIKLLSFPLLLWLLKKQMCLYKTWYRGTDEPSMNSWVFSLARTFCFP